MTIDIKLTAYPDDGYNSWISYNEACTRIEGTPTNALAWSANDFYQQGALIQAFNELNTLELSIDLAVDDSPLSALQAAQCEQAAHILRKLQKQDVASISISGGMSVKMETSEDPYRDHLITPRALNYLKPYLMLPVIHRTR